MLRSFLALWIRASPFALKHRDSRLTVSLATRKTTIALARPDPTRGGSAWTLLSYWFHPEGILRRGRERTVSRAHEPGQDRLCTLAGCTRLSGTAARARSGANARRPPLAHAGQHKGGTTPFFSLFFFKAAELRAPSPRARGRPEGHARRHQARGATHSFPRRGSELPLR